MARASRTPLFVLVAVLALVSRTDAKRHHNNKHDGGVDGCDGDACEEQLHTGRQGAAQPSLPLTGTADASMPQAPRAEGQVVEAVEKTWSLKRKKHQQQKRKQKKKKQNPSADSTEEVEGAAAVSQTSTPPLFGESVQSPPPPPTSEADQATRKGRTRRAKAGRRRRRNEPAAAENQAPLSTATAESVDLRCRARAPRRKKRPPPSVKRMTMTVGTRAGVDNGAAVHSAAKCRRASPRHSRAPSGRERRSRLYH